MYRKRIISSPFFNFSLSKSTFRDKIKTVQQQTNKQIKTHLESEGCASLSLATTTVASINVAFYTTRRRRRRKSWLLLLLFFYDSLCSARCIYADVDGYTVQIDKLKKRWEDCPARYARNEAKKRSRRRRRKKNNNRQQPTNKQFQVKSWSEEWKGVCARHDKLVISCLGNRGRRRRKFFFLSFFLSRWPRERTVHRVCVPKEADSCQVPQKKREKERKDSTEAIHNFNEISLSMGRFHTSHSL